MPWKELSSMNQKLSFVREVLRERNSFSGICQVHGISRKTGYKWIERYKEFGQKGLEEQCRAPKNSPHKISDEVRNMLLCTRMDHQFWGPRKILAFLKSKNRRLVLPAASSVGELYKAEGLIKSNRRRIKPVPHPAPVVEGKNPNDVWAADFKGEFRMRNGKLCYPLTISDHVSRFILCCSGQVSNNYPDTRKAFEKTFYEYGLPSVILSDNGVPFSTPSGLSQLSVWWIKLGIKPIRIQPGNPQQNGRHERMHRTLKQETARPPSQDMKFQQKSFDRFVKEYNFDRPHQSLKYKVPSKTYRASPRKMPRKLPKIEYPLHFEKRAIGSNGEIKWYCNAIFISSALANEHIGIEEIEDGLHQVYFGPLKMGFLHDATNRFVRTEVRY